MFVQHFKKCIGFTRSYSKLVAYHSASTIPFQNLAFEEWIYENVDLSSSACIFIWRSNPSVVVGRHQNPWAECDVRGLIDNGCFLARRQTGGGTVYHDMGNVNITYFTPRSSYDRRFNLKIIVNAITKKWPALKLDINCRDDIILDERYKVSGSAAKLGRKNSYHHCTLLLNSNLLHIKQFLHSHNLDIDTKATRSVVSPTTNLSNYISRVTYEDIRDTIFEEFFLVSDCSSQPTIALIDPTNDELFPGISGITSKISSWEWVYGKSPKFDVQWLCSTSELGDLKVIMSIVNGAISNVEWNIDHKFVGLMQDFVTAITGIRFTRQAILDRWFKYRADSGNENERNYLQGLDKLVRKIVKSL